MTPRARLTWQVAAAVWVVLVMAVLGGGRYPWWTDACVYLATGTGVIWAVGQFLDWREARAEGRHPDDDAAPITREEALREAADWVITARPADDFTGRTLTAAMVQREALLRSALEATEEEAAGALAARLRHRGYR